MLILCFL
jgi:predicted RNase H-like nuclease (RuvC/YqgF family)